MSRCLAASASAWTVSPWARPPSSSVGRRTSSSFLSWRPGIGCRAREVVEALWPHLTADAGAANLRKAARVACARQSRPRSCSAADRSRPRPRPKRRPMCGDSRTRATLVCTPAICCPRILRRVDARGARSLAARGCSGPSIKQADTDDRQSPHPGRGSSVGSGLAMRRLTALCRRRTGHRGDKPRLRGGATALQAWRQRAPTRGSARAVAAPAANGDKH